MSKAITITCIMWAAMAVIASAREAPLMPVPSGTVKEMSVLPFGPSRLIARNIFDVIVAPPVMPPGPFASGDDKPPQDSTIIPPRLEWECVE